MTQKREAGKPRLDPAPRPKLPTDTPPLALLPFPRAAEVSGHREPGPLSLVDGPDEAKAAFATASGLAGRLFPNDPPIFGGTGGIACRARHEAMSDDAYRIAFTPEEVTVFAGSRSGFLYAFITLGQLSRGARVAPGEFVFPATGEISDQPRFGWRGMHLDVARQPYDIAHVERFLDSLAWEKLNRFHLHLTDDEGWRFDVPGYPQLADIAAWRGHGLAVPPLLGSPAARHGLVYSRAELGGLVRRAGELGVTIVPEVDIPGHCYCVLQAIPALRDPGETGIYRSIQYFPNDALNPAVPETYDFLEAVLGELAGIFPSPWLHVGGDEVADDAWLGSPAALALMKERGWTEIHQLQAYFLQRVQKMISGLGRGTGAWEEAALGGGIDPAGSYLVAWRKSASGLALAEQGYAVVLAPAQHYYLDMAQSDAMVGARGELGGHRLARDELRLRAGQRLARHSEAAPSRRAGLPVEREPARAPPGGPHDLPAAVGARRDGVDPGGAEGLPALQRHRAADAADGRLSGSGGIPPPWCAGRAPSKRSVRHVRQEIAEPLGLRLAEYLVRGAGFDDRAVVHEDGARRDLAGEAHLVGDDEHGGAGFGERRGW